MSLEDYERHFASLNSYSVSESFASGRSTSEYNSKEEKLHYIPIWILGKGAFGEADRGKQVKHYFYHSHTHTPLFCQSKMHKKMYWPVLLVIYNSFSCMLSESPTKPGH
uniref:Uncharacterized protein n=1 Tax=Oncorhynchus mykiss TaxID=8022 RepID=A0A8C7TIG7_ONCMY